MKALVSYSNCQGGACLHFLKKTGLGDHLEMVQVNNWQCTLIEAGHTREFLHNSLRRADILLFQPHKEYLCVDGVIVPNSDDLIKTHCKPECIKVSWSYQYNSGFFPVVKVGLHGVGGFVTSDCVKECAKRGPDFIRDAYEADDLHYDCARRVLECFAEQSRREQSCDVAMVPWFLEHYKNVRLFLNENHPTSAVFVELARRILEKLADNPIGIGDVAAKALHFGCPIPWTTENEANLPGALPVHRAAVRELGLEYPADADDQVYRKWLEELAQV